MTIQDLKDKDLIIYECISGSRAFGLETKSSDTDIKGVFVLPRDDYYSLEYTPQVSNESNDIVYYELGRFIELLTKSNPNILELLFTPDDCVLKTHELIHELRSLSVLTKQCQFTFGEYAMTQIRKAKGLNKKILNPILKERKTVLDFCHVLIDKEAIRLTDFLELNKITQTDCGLSKVNHMNDLYALFIGKGYSGIIRSEKSNELAMSSIPKGEVPSAFLSFNQSAYSKYCKEYKEYWDWVNDRNENRYKNNVSHGKSYDAKNMMHVFRLLNTCLEIATENRLNVRRKDRDELLAIKSGQFEYDELMVRANELHQRIKDSYSECDLIENIKRQDLENQLIKWRVEFYF
ncbi:nucleotidyltransferase domain-containing protein [Reichenbachiella versicolor]|uniref:nucleotidyltransferase domain-containing protein n=1 Tax=Reichenbachiella versicolor TaxID=1821036 RepID=UPI000D6E0B68|nr:nucleotidyltransferase domain-containing protein [Reichenbachiella versicolor]